MSEVKVDLSKVKPKKAKETVTKLDLSKKKEDAVQEPSTDEVPVLNQPETSGEVEKGTPESKPEGTTEEVTSSDDGGEQEEVVIQEITEEEVKPVVEQTEDKVKVNLPEGVDKLVKFIEETGGDLQDYVRLNADYSNVDDKALLKEYYKKTKPHLDDEEIDFVMEENFLYDEDLDDERDIKLKKLAQKEEVSKARSFLDNLKDEYYEEIKSRPTQSNEQRKAMDFFNRYKESEQQAEESRSLFKSNTKNFFQNDFKGFDFNVGEKKFRYGVSNPDSIAETQSNINNILGKFLDDKGNVKQFDEYHKAMYAAQNVDKIASHFYEQGKADAIKDVAVKSKNITGEAPRQTSNDSLFINGLKVKAVNGIDSSKLKVNKNKFKN
ncbi:hypothetical protein [Planktomarina sp.]|uniref:hypothetical protein n=1 Tax=Planktomarina sp. TaxID=2024851 RepID=UPI0032606372